MSSLLTKKDIPLEIIQPDPIYIVKSITPRYRYEDGKRTSDIVGYLYDCVNTGTYDLARICIEGAKKPIISNEDLALSQESGNHLFVEFDNARLHPYYSTSSRQIEDSIKADNVHIVKDK